MKYLLLLATLTASYVQAACLPGPLLLNPGSSKNLLDLERSVESFQEELKKEIPPEMNLIVRLETLNNRVNADIIKENNQIIVQIFGGMLRHPEMEPEVLQLLLCHELGHFLGGPPLKSRAGWSSTEGQADYFSGSKCAYMLRFDEATFTDAAIKLTTIYAEVGQQAPPELTQCDRSEVTRTNYGYPSTQCRLDTLVAGWRGLARPRCWYFE